MADDKNRLRKTYSFFRQQPVYASGGGGGGGGGTTDQFWYSTTPGSIYTTGSVAIRGGSSGIDAPSDLGAGIFFYVSGSIASTSVNYTNISLFGGDVVVSGSLKSLTALSGSLTKLADGTSYLIAGSGVSISTGSTGAVTITSTAIPGGSTTQVQFNDGGTFGGDSGLTYNKTTDTLTGVNVVLSGDLTVNGTMTTVNTNNLEVKDAIIGLGFASGSVGQSGNDRGLILGLGNSPHAAFLWKHSESEFAIGSTTSSATGSLPIALSSYSNFHANNIQGSIITASLGFSGSLTKLVDGTSYLVAGPNITIVSSSNGQVTISSTAAGSGDQFFSSTTAASIFTTGSAAFIGGEGGVDSPVDKGTNVFFYVSGSISGSGVNDKRALFGGDVVISGSLRQGLQTSASGFYSHAEGQNTIASATSAHAEGSGTTASGLASHAEGLSTTASAIAAHAEGQFTVASGWYSHAEGTSTTASGVGSHAEGNSTEAVGTYSLAAGIGTIASGTAQNVFGKYNLRNNASSLFVIGDGTSSLDASRGDILRVNAGPSIGRGRFDVTGTISANVGLSGSLTRLTDGTSYLIAGSNVTITSASNGSVTISASGGGGSGDPDASYVVLSATGSLSSERVLSAGTGLFLSDAGAGGNVTLSINDSVVATISGSTFTGAVKFDQGLSGSLTRLVDGSSYLVAGTNVAISSASNGQVTISSSGGGTPAGSNTEIQFNNVGSFGASANLNFNSSTNRLSLTGSLGMKGDIVPDADTTYNLGTSDNRWANVYTGDLHLRNDRGDWTIVEERDYLCVVNNITGKKYKMMLQPLDNE